MKTIGALIVCALGAGSACSGATYVTVDAGKADRPAGPVWFKLPRAADVAVPPGAVKVADAESGEPVPAQADADGRICVWLDAMKAGQQRKLKVVDADKDAKPTVVVEEKSPTKIAVTLAGKEFTAYNHPDDSPRPYLYPLIGPTGDAMTRNYPMVKDARNETDADRDHPHHRSLWTAWGNVNGVSHWENGPDKGIEKQKKIDRLESGPVFGRIAATVEWFDPKTAKRQLTDHRVYTFYRPTDDARLIDVEVTLDMTDGDVTFGDTKEGGFVALRVAASMTEKNKGGTIRNANGQKGEKQAWGQPADWCDYSGKVGDHVAGLTIMDNPQNVGHPTPYHVRSYGLFTANPFGLSDFRKPEKIDGSKTFKKGEKVTFRYRVLIHKGDADAADLPAQYSLYADPPKVAPARP